MSLFCLGFVINHIIVATTSLFHFYTMSSTKSLYEMEMISSPSSTSSNPLRRVQFQKRIRFRRILHLNQYTAEEIDATWFTESECNEIRERALDEINDILDSEQFGTESDEYTSRGLEGRTQLGLSRKLVNRHRSIDAVLDEQDYQRQEGIKDEEVIANVYLQITAKCQIYANFMAQCDELDADYSTEYLPKEPKSQSMKKTKQSAPRQDDNMDNLLKTTAKLRKMKAKKSGKIRRKSSSMTLVQESPTSRAA